MQHSIPCYANQVQAALSRAKKAKTRSAAVTAFNILSELIDRGRQGSRRASQKKARANMREARILLCERFRFPKGQKF